MQIILIKERIILYRLNTFRSRIDLQLSFLNEINKNRILNMSSLEE